MRRLLLCLSLLTATAFADDRGLELARTADQRASGYKDMGADLTMVLKDKLGRESRRELAMQVLEGTSDGDRSLLRFDVPADVKGTALLTHAHSDRADDQWLYLPALKRVKRISSSSQSGSFMGSEFSYEDIKPFEVEAYSYRYLGEDKVGAETWYRLERLPVDKDSGYTRQVAWLDGKEYRWQKIEFHDRKSTLLKTLTFTGYQRYGNQWRPAQATMVNAQTGKSTVLQWQNYRFGAGLNGKDFTPEALANVD